MTEQIDEVNKTEIFPKNNYRTVAFKKDLFRNGK